MFNLHSSKVFTDENIMKYIEPFDWLNSVATRLSPQFPGEPLMKNLTNLAIHRYSNTSFTCGVSDMMAGRIIYCLKGTRLFMAMSLEKVSTTFTTQFRRETRSLRDCASWVHQMPLEMIMTDGFYSMIGEGDILVIPPNHVILEACLGNGDDQCDVITWPCLLQGGQEWRSAFNTIRSAGFLSVDPAGTEQSFSKAVQVISAGMNLLEKVLLLSDVKLEPSTPKFLDNAYCLDLLYPSFVFRLRNLCCIYVCFQFVSGYWVAHVHLLRLWM